MTGAAAEVQSTPGTRARGLLGGLARQREVSLVLVMVVLATITYLRAPQFLSPANLIAVTSLAAIIAIIAVGEALVIITRNVDLSVEAMVALVAYVVADVLKQQALSVPEAWAFGIGLGLLLGVFNGLVVTILRVPAIVATLGTLSIYRGIDYVIASGKQVTINELPPGYGSLASATFAGIPIFVWVAVVIVTVVALLLHQTRFGRQVYAVGSNPEAATILGIRSRLVVFSVFAACGLLAGVGGVMWGIYFGAIEASAASGVTLQVIAACVVGGVNIFGGSGTVVGAALGALFLGLISNALLLLRFSQFWLQAIYGIVILGAVAADAAIVRRVQRAVAVGRR